MCEGKGGGGGGRRPGALPRRQGVLAEIQALLSAAPSPDSAAWPRGSGRCPGGLQGAGVEPATAANPAALLQVAMLVRADCD